MHYNVASLQRKLTSSSVSQPLRAARAAIQTHRKNQVGQAVARESIDNISFQALTPITQFTTAAQDRITNCCNNFSDSGSSGVELIGSSFLPLIPKFRCGRGANSKVHLCMVLE